MSTVTTPPPPQLPPEALPLEPLPAEPPRRPWWMAKRFLLGAVGVALLSGVGAAALALGEVNKIVDALRQSKPVKVAPRVLAPTVQGEPETLLLVGNDQRPPPKSNPYGAVLRHSNEMLLVRIDPSKPTISMLSIPRELQVTFTAPSGQVVTDRINSAYTYGGVELMLTTIKRLLGIPINHVFVTTFKKFKRAVDEMGCVYMTVDRRYFHENIPGGEQYFEINLQPGYQRLCGTQALEFVANRHEDTSLTRDARDQRFLLEAKTQYGPTLFENRERFERIFGRAVETDLHGSSQVLELLELLVQAQGKPVRQVPFHVNLLSTYDTATPQQIHESVQSFLAGTAPLPRHRLNDLARATRHHTHRHSAAHTVGTGLVPTTSAELDQARALAPLLPFQLEYPRARDTFAGAEQDTLRRYDVRDPQGHLHPSYVVVIDRGQLGEFYDVQGTTWTDPPLLSKPSQEIQIGSRTYGLFYVGEQIRTVAWHEGNAAYWIQNTLTNSVPPRQMVEMAELTRSVDSSAPVTSAVPTTPTVHMFSLPPRTAPTASLPFRVGALLGFLALAVLLYLALRVLARQRELRALRAQVEHAMELEARRHRLLRTAAGQRAPPA
jgi:LCP family protein required for cell wall assembly